MIIVEHDDYININKMTHVGQLNGNRVCHN